MKTNKIQALLINHLLKHGHIQLRLPDGVLLEIGITEENENGKIQKSDEYCWVIAKKENRAAVIDSYNLQHHCGFQILNSESIFVREKK